MPLQRARLLFVGTFLLFSQVSFAQQYTVTDLGRLPGAIQSRATAINGPGQVVGVSDSGAGPEQWHPFLWTAGTMQDLGMLPDASQCVPTAINDIGQLVGICFGSGSSAFVWSQDTGITAFGPVGSGAYGINNQGDIVGEYV